MTPHVVRGRAELSAALADRHPGLVPTMGALHDGHLALIRRSVEENPLTVVSVFVNPTQFHEPADLAQYPRDLDADATLATNAGADLVFAPEVEAIYPAGFATTVAVGGLTEAWEGARRPGHFQGVATVVAILLGLIRPARSYFGEKDYQQLQMIRRLHRDLALPGEIIAVPTVRDHDGLALASRNTRLSPAARTLAAAIPRATAAVDGAARAGECAVDRLEAIGRAELKHPGIAVDYFAIVDGDTLEPLLRVVPGARLLVAAEIEGVRLIDNAPIAVEAVPR
jgi:pantoate--beta-alanine ligase